MASSSPELPDWARRSVPGWWAFSRCSATSSDCSTETLGLNGVVLLAAGAFLLVWTFLSGGVVARYARGEENHGRRVFFGDSATYFFRFLRILAISLLLYAALFKWVAGPLNGLVDRATRDVTSERTALTYSLLVYAIVAAAVWHSSALSRITRR